MFRRPSLSLAATLCLFPIFASFAEPPPNAQGAGVSAEVRLDDVLRAGHSDWQYFKNDKVSKGGVGVVKNKPEAGQFALRLFGDFSEGGSFAAAAKELNDLEASSVDAIRLRMMSPNVASYSVQVTDASGQTHQRKGIKFDGDGTWRDVVIDPKDIAGGEHWGGANDGKLKQPVKSFALSIRPDAERGVTKPELFLTDIRADVVQGTMVEMPSSSEGFETGVEKWKVTGDVRRVSEGAMKGGAALRLERPLDKLTQPIEAAGPSFPAGPGTWRLSGGSRAAIHSPDNSYHGLVEIQWLDGNGGVIERQIVNETYNQPAWQAFSRQLDAPAGTVAGRYALTLKKTYGWFEVDDLSASRLAAPSARKVIDRINITSSAVGNLFLPEEKIAFDIAVRSAKPLGGGAREAAWVVRDQGGAEYGAGKVALEEKGYKNRAFTCEGRIELPADSIPIGTYRELHVVADPAGSAYADYRGFARLPAPASAAFEPRKIPFSIRNWDARVGGFVELANRLGFRMVNLWGEYKADAPDKPNVGNLDRLSELGMKAEIGVRAVAMIEQGKPEFTLEGLATGVPALVEKAGGNAAYYCLGNEPHGGPEEIKRNVAAYKAAYEAIKTARPDAFVVGTSHGPDEEYFKAGYHKYLDAYDFHIYESYRDIPARIEEFRRLGKKYGAEKPVYCTEMGLNSQGMSRDAVGVEMIKKFAAFFSAGGDLAAWFTIMYPDAQGKLRGTSGEAHNMFDARYREFNPKLDAIVHYHFLNTFLDKRFVEKETSGDGAERFLFADDKGACLQILWNDRALASAAIPLPGVDKVRLIHLDGSASELTPADGSVTLGLSPTPLLLSYSQARPALGKFGEGTLRLASPVSSLVRGEPKTFDLEGPALAPESLRVQAPPGWKSALAADGADRVRLTLTAPEETEAREGFVVVQKISSSGQPAGELPLSLPVTGRLAMSLLPAVTPDTGAPAVRLEVVNHGDEPATVSWAMNVAAQFSMADNVFKLDQPEPPAAFFAEAASGDLTIPAASSQSVTVPLRDLDAQNLYKITAQVTEYGGGSHKAGRLMGGFAGVLKTAVPPKLDGSLDDDPAWKNAPILVLGESRQYHPLPRKVNKPEPWDGPADLSAKLRFLWDDAHLYVAVDVTDDLFVGGKQDDLIWEQDGLQFLIDPSRASSYKPGKYDYIAALGAKGPQAWRSLSAFASLPAGEASDVKIAVRRLDDNTGRRVYEIAFPWASLAPFKPKPGANLGLTMIANEDDGIGRGGFIGWFSGSHSKILDTVGDLILLGEPEPKP